MKYKVVVLVILFSGLFGTAMFLRNQKHQQPTKTTVKKSYVALGDSVSAGVGLFTNSDSSACDRTDESYPIVLAKKLEYEVINISCSGATLPEGITGKQTVNGLQVASQVDQLFEKTPTPDVITMTIGANDAGWVNALASCYTTTCGSASDTEKIDQAIQLVSANLSTALRRIKDHFNEKQPRLVVTGYYTVISAAAACSDTLGIDAQEVVWLNTQLAKLNANIRTSVGDFDFATFMPIDFTGHELCTTQTWLQGLQDRKPYHPNEEGQKAIASQLEPILVKSN